MVWKNIGQTICGAKRRRHQDIQALKQLVQYLLGVAMTMGWSCDDYDYVLTVVIS